MSLNRWEQIEGIFQDALDLAPAERNQFVKEKCENDAELKQEVEKLLANFDSADSFIESPVWTDSNFLNTNAKKDIKNSIDKFGVNEKTDLMKGRRIGVYELREEIGRGGMGTVFLAKRVDGEFDQSVAIKLIRRGMDTDLILERFRRERQILATLNHQNIAFFYGGGSTEDGLPYFVMEYIEGRRLYRYCDENRLNITERLKVFRQVCEAVEAAHNIHVIHRDIKPSNILVKSDGNVKLLDFGIAKVLNTEPEATEIEPTATQMRVLTPEYASPEQVCGETVTPASDIYSLGVVLYELMTGHRPYQLKRQAPHEIARVICEEEPSRPSGSVSRKENLLPAYEDEKSSLDFVFSSRKSSLENLQSELSGDLDRIILKALRKNPLQRYQSAAELAEDVVRFLEKRPVKAESFLPESARAMPLNPPPSPVRTQDDRHSVAILPFKIFSAAIAGETSSDEFLGIGLTDALVSRLSSVQRLVVRPTSSVLRFSENTDPFFAGEELGVNYIVEGNIRRFGETLRVTAQLLKVSERNTLWAGKFDEKFTDVLSLEDSISQKIGELLLPHLTGTEQKQLQKRGTNNAEAAAAYMRGRYFWNQFTHESLPKALLSFQKAAALDPDYALAHIGIADFYNWACIYGLVPPSESYPKLMAATRRALEIDPMLGEACAELGLTQSNQWKYAEAEKSHRRAIELNPSYSLAHEWLSAVLVSTGRFEEGVEEIDIAEKLDPLSLRAKTLTAWTYYQVRQYDRAIAKAYEIIELDKNYPQGPLQAGVSMPHIGKTREAVEMCRKAFEMMPNSTLTFFPLCFALAADGQIKEARKYLNQLKDMATKTYVKPYFLAICHIAVGEIDRAFEYLEIDFAEQDMWCIWFGTEPILDVIRSDPRYLKLFRRTNNPILKRFEK